MTLRAIARWLVWPTYLTMFLGSFAWTRMLGFDPGVSILAISGVHIGLVALTELVLPARHEWAWVGDRQVFNDILHSILLAPGARMGSAALTVLISTATAKIAFAPRMELWPSQWPFCMQLVLAVLIYDFADYWKHRAYHRWRWLWAIHALHHNPRRMHVFKAGRLHFLEAAIRSLISLAPLVMLGAPAEVFFWLAAFANALGGQNHWNVDARLPAWLHYVLATPHVHWLHHGRELDKDSVNLSPFTLLFDHLFGTFRYPPLDHPADTGIGYDPIPTDLPAQLIAPYYFNAR